MAFGALLRVVDKLRTREPVFVPPTCFPKISWWFGDLGFSEILQLDSCFACVPVVDPQFCFSPKKALFVTLPSFFLLSEKIQKKGKAVQTSDRVDVVGLQQYLECVE